MSIRPKFPSPKKATRQRIVARYVTLVVVSEGPWKNRSYYVTCLGVLLRGYIHNQFIYHTIIRTRRSLGQRLQNRKRSRLVHELFWPTSSPATLQSRCYGPFKPLAKLGLLLRNLTQVTSIWIFSWSYGFGIITPLI